MTSVWPILVQSILTIRVKEIGSMLEMQGRASRSQTGLQTLLSCSSQSVRPLAMQPARLHL